MTTQTKDESTFDPALNMARQSLYRFAALTLLDPRAGAWDRLNELRGDHLLDEAATLVRGQPAAEARPLGRGERPLADLDPAPVLRLLPRTRDGLNEAFERTFGLLVSAACPPYETEYINGKLTFQRSQALADVSGFYSAFGLEPSLQHPERPDHIVLELEFMAFLLAQERRAPDGCSAVAPAADAGETPAPQGARAFERAAVCCRAQQKFLSEHLAWWTPAFAVLIAREDPQGFYESAGVFLAALIGAERGILDVEAPADRAGPSTLERPEECEGCLLSP